MSNNSIHVKIAAILREIGTRKCLEKAKILEENSTSINSLNLRSLALNSSNVSAIMNCIKQEETNKNHCIKSISFSYNTLLGDSGAIVFAKSLPKSFNEIGLVNCGISDIGGVQLLDWMEKSTHLKMICIEGNHFSEKLRIELRKYAVKNPQTLVVF